MHLAIRVSCASVCLHMQESVEEMGLYEDVSSARGASVEVTVTPAVSDVIQHLQVLSPAKEKQQNAFPPTQFT